MGFLPKISPKVQSGSSLLAITSTPPGVVAVVVVVGLAVYLVVVAVVVVGVPTSPSPYRTDFGKIQSPYMMQMAWKDTGGTDKPRTKAGQFGNRALAATCSRAPIMSGGEALLISHFASQKLSGDFSNVVEVASF